MAVAYYVKTSLNGGVGELRSELSASPCLPGAPRLWVLDTVSFSHIIGAAFSNQPSAVMLITRLKFHVIYNLHMAYAGSVTPPKVY